MELYHHHCIPPYFLEWQWLQKKRLPEKALLSCARGRNLNTGVSAGPKILEKIPYLASQNDAIPYLTSKDKISQYNIGFIFCYLNSTTVRSNL
jgi:hypothetical protein